MGERGAGLVLRAVSGWVLGLWLAGGTTLHAQECPSLPGQFPPVCRSSDGAPGDPADYLSFLHTLSQLDPEVPSSPALALPRFPPDPREVVQTGSLPALAPEPPAASPPAALPEDPSTPRKVSTSTQGTWGALTGNVTLTGDETSLPWEEPMLKRTWQADQSWRCDVAGPLSAFGQLGGNSDEAGQADMKVNARTGLACKVPVAGLAEVVLRGGPGFSSTDPLRPDRTLSHDWLFEVQARCPLVFGAGLEYQASALPALTAQTQDQLNQDLRVAFPVGSAGKLKLGARHRWASTSDPRQWTDSMQLYLGLELAR